MKSQCRPHGADTGKTRAKVQAGGRRGRGRKASLTPETINKLMVSAILIKLRRGRSLTRREEGLLRDFAGVSGAHGSDRARAGDADSRHDGGPADGDGGSVYLSRAAFRDWLETQGIKISLKNLYKTYLAKHAKNPLVCDDLGRVHKWASLEIIRMVRQGAPGSTPENEQRSDRRQEADLRLLEGKVERVKMDLREWQAERVHVAQVNCTWRHAMARLRAGLARIASTVPEPHRARLAAEYDGLMAVEAEGYVEGRGSPG